MKYPTNITETLKYHCISVCFMNPYLNHSIEPSCPWSLTLLLFYVPCCSSFENVCIFYQNSALQALNADSCFITVCGMVTVEALQQCSSCLPCSVLVNVLSQTMLLLPQDYGDLSWLARAVA